jgi:hypothetical protein
MEKIDKNKLEKFLLNAHLQVYGNPGYKTLTFSGIRTLSYIEGLENGLDYRNSWIEGDHRIGQEIVSVTRTTKDEVDPVQVVTPVWSMVYTETVLTKRKVDVKEVYKFRTQALCQSGSNVPELQIMGASNFTLEDWHYHNECRGDIESFEGISTIRYKNVPVYRCNYRGGLLLF